MTFGQTIKAEKSVDLCKHVRDALGKDGETMDLKSGAVRVGTRVVTKQSRGGPVVRLDPDWAEELGIVHGDSVDFWKVPGLKALILVPSKLRKKY